MEIFWNPFTNNPRYVDFLLGCGMCTNVNIDIITVNIDIYFLPFTFTSTVGCRCNSNLVSLLNLHSKPPVSIEKCIEKIQTHDKFTDYPLNIFNKFILNNRVILPNVFSI